MSKIAYRMVDVNGYGRIPYESGKRLWLPIGTIVRSPRVLGVSEKIDAYIAPEVAVLTAMFHDVGSHPRLMRIKSSKKWMTDGLKRWTYGDCKVLEEVPIPELTLEERIAWVICIVPHPSTRAWAIRWLSGEDRSREAALEAKSMALKESIMAAAATAAAASAATEDIAVSTVAAEAVMAAVATAHAPTTRDSLYIRAEEFEESLMLKLALARAILAGKLSADHYDEEESVNRFRLVQGRRIGMEKNTNTQDRMLKWFDVEHLPEKEKVVSIKFYELACSLCGLVEPGPERTAALRDLLGAKDSTIRALIAMDVS